MMDSDCSAVLSPFKLLRKLYVNQSKRPRVSDVITIIGVTQAMLIGEKPAQNILIKCLVFMVLKFWVK